VAKINDTSKKAELKELARRRKDEAKVNYEVKLQYQYQYYLNMANSRKTKAAGTAGWRSNFSYPTTATMIRSYIPRLVTGLIGPEGSNFFSMNPRKDVDASGQPTRASIDVMTAIQNAHMQENGVFRSVIEGVERNGSTFGVGYIIQTWQYEKEEWDYEIIAKNGKDIIPGKGQRITNKPLWYVPSTINLWVDPGANSWNEITYVIERRFSRLSQIQKRAQRERYTESDIVLRLADVLNTSLVAVQSEGNNSGDLSNVSGVDPVEETYTIYTRDYWITLWRDEMIDCRENPLAHHNIPVYPFIFENDTYTYLPKGIPAILSDIQQAQDVMQNLMIDNLNITVNTILVKPATAFLDESNLRWEPGTVMTESVPNTLRRLELGGTNPEGFKLIENLAGLANQSLSTQDFMSAPAGVAAVNKTYGGIRLINQESNKQIMFIIASQKANGLVPMLQDLKSLYNQFMSEEDATNVIGAEMARAINYDAKKRIAWDCDYDYIISGDLSIIDKQAKLENLEQGMQLLGAMGYNVNKDLVAKQIVDSLELDKSILLPQGAPNSTISPTPQPGAAGTVDPNAMPNPMNPGNQPNVAPKPQGPAAPIGPANTAVPGQGGTPSMGIVLKPEEEQLIAGIAGKLGVPPQHLLADVKDGLIPGGMQGLIKLVSDQKGRNQLKAILIQGHKNQA
jgi:hypothetical protein